GLDDVDRRERADLDFCLVFVERLFRQFQRLLFHIQVLAREDKVPIRFLRLNNETRQLKLEGGFRNFFRVLALKNLPQVDDTPAILQQVLSYGVCNRSDIGRIEDAVVTVCQKPVHTHVHAETGAGGEELRDVRVEESGVLNARRCAIELRGTENRVAPDVAADS